MDTRLADGSGLGGNTKLTLVLHSVRLLLCHQSLVDLRCGALLAADPHDKIKAAKQQYATTLSPRRLTDLM